MTTNRDESGGSSGTLPPLSKETEDYLSSIYFTPSSPVSYSGFEQVWKYVKPGGRVSKPELKRWLLAQDVYTGYRPVNTKFRRPKVIVPYANAVYGSDTGYMTSFDASVNDGYKYFAVFIDIFTRFAWTFPMKTLRGAEMLTILQQLFASNKPEKLHTDRGSEYTSKLVEAYLKKERVEHYTSLNEKKVAHAERLIKRIKLKLVKHMNQHNTNNWVDVLEDVTTSYNQSYHRVIKMTPTEARSADQHTVWTNQYVRTRSAKPDKKKARTAKQKPRRNQPAFRFNYGDRVKLLALRKPFDREYDEKYTTEIFTVIDRKIQDGVDMYTIKDELNQPIIGRFYRNELLGVVVPENKTYKIEKVLRKRTRKGKKELFVKFKGYPKQFNAWVSDVDYLVK